AYEEAISQTASAEAPWFIIPADKKWFARIAISRIIVETLQSIDMKMPELSEDEKAKLMESRKQLLSEPS
ncbi:MAG TPA: polyphosphate kinase 2 family protein, partial [Sphingobacteriaceae bacterium]